MQCVAVRAKGGRGNRALAETLSPDRNASRFLQPSFVPSTPFPSPTAARTASTRPTTPSLTTLTALSAGLTPLLAASPALAGPGGDNHLLTGQLVSLLHPAIMFFLFGATGWAGWLGWQWRRARELPAEVKALKAQLPPAREDGTRPASPLDAEIKAKEEARRERRGGGEWGGRVLRGRTRESASD